MRTLLHREWTVEAVGGSGLGQVPEEIAGVAVPADVPGCVHTDLLAAGLIPDPYLDENEAALAWIGRVDWRYRTTFDWQAGDAVGRVDLVCAGLDTVARIELNGIEIARTRNMHRGYRFDIRQALRAGHNELAITFTSALDHVARMADRLGARPHVNRFPFNMIRKMACNFGWDWGPELVTAGIWRPIALEQWSTARLAAVRPLTDVDDDTGKVTALVDVERDPARASRPLVVTARVGEHTAQTVLDPKQSTGTVEVVVPRPRLWWPRGYGEQARYPVEVTLSEGDAALDSWRGETGFRTVRLHTEPDEYGTPLRIVVNDTPVFVRGVNWIPDDCFPHRVDRARYRDRLCQARDAGVNLVRVWGGGIYESDDFYDLCDELGLLTWQDFLFSCAAYPEEEPLRGEVLAEARQAVTRLAAHPSLVLWNGCNENIWGYRDWRWREELGTRTWGAGYYLDVLPKIVAELDPTRPYLPGSPWSLSGDIHPNDPDHGCMHLWDVWNERDYVHYRDHVPRFAAEFGFQAPPTWSTLTRSVHDRPLTSGSPGMLSHQKAEDGARKLDNGLAHHFRPQRNFEDWFLATQLNQARAIRLGVEHFRSWSPRCAGSVVWQLNDCWPVTSWSVIDGDGRRKPSWYALRRAHADRLLTVQPRDTGLAVVFVNDCAEPVATSVRVARRSFDGTVLAEDVLTVQTGPRGTTTVAIPVGVATAGAPAEELLTATAGNTFPDVERALWYFAPDLDITLPEPELATSALPVPGGYRIDVTAHALVRDLVLLADRVAVDAVVDDMLVTLLPGESVSLLVRTSAEIDPDTLLAPDVLRSANQLR